MQVGQVGLLGTCYWNISTSAIRTSLDFKLNPHSNWILKLNNVRPTFDCGARIIKLKLAPQKLLFSFLVDTNYKQEKKTTSSLVVSFVVPGIINP
ncbi:hypothetical protein KEM48_007259 [Puccinia striiformis f. sp. tritici PST-130]|nr:hypothetical protein H4Q26_007231 [Puccinia striiformis f. sp. tritici PST-130]KAI9622368.1 hypothetical protein KEM48_007259 [Puccinia striiformis f. sp. tritici PST-130]